MKTASSKADLLVIGGGIAGCMAAIRGRELGLRVTVWDKANPRRSGGATTGIDHCWAYIPEIHADLMSPEQMLSDHLEAAGGFGKPELVKAIIEDSFARVGDLERFGVPMRDERGEFRLIKKIHRAPSFIHFAGRDLKVRLSTQMHRQHVHVERRVMGVELLVDKGRVIGAVGVSTREPTVHVCSAQAVLLSTGSTFRLFPPPTRLLFNIAFPPHDSGDGQAMAFRAGARLVNMEFLNFQQGPKNFARCGKGSYVPGGRVINGFGLPLGQAPDKGEKSIDKATESPEAFRKETAAGRGPLYMDLRGASNEDVEYIRWALNNEGNSAYLNYLDEEGWDFHYQPIEWDVYEPKQSAGLAGLDINSAGETSLRGLFAAGDVVGAVPRSVCPGALTYGYRAAESAAKYIAAGEALPLEGTATSTVEAILERSSRFLGRSRGAGWVEALIAFQNIMADYGGLLRSAVLLEKGLEHLDRLKDRIDKEGRASNPHELYRFFEVLNLVELGRVIMKAALHREESRVQPWARRADFPEQDDLHWRKLLAIWQEDGDPCLDEIPLGTK